MKKIKKERKKEKNPIKHSQHIYFQENIQNSIFRKHNKGERERERERGRISYKKTFITRLEDIF